MATAPNDFRTWLETATAAGVPNVMPVASSKPTKMWRASREDILKHWNSLRPSQIVFRPLPEDKKGSTFTEDGIRFTGTREFIDACLARFKDLLSYENMNTKLDVVWRQIGPKNIVDVRDGVPTYVFYLYIKERSPGQNIASVAKTSTALSATED